MIDLLVGIAAIWGAVLSTILALLRFFLDRYNMKFKVESSHYWGDPDRKHGFFGIVVNLSARNKGKITCINKITLTIEGTNDEFETKTGKSEDVPEEGFTCFPPMKIEDRFQKGHSKIYELIFLDENLSSILHKNMIKSEKKELECKLTIYDTYKINELDFIFKT